MVPRHDDKCDDDLIVCKRCVGSLLLQIFCNEKVMEATDLQAHKESSEIELDQLRSSLHAAVAESIIAKSFAEALKEDLLALSELSFSLSKTSVC